MSRPAVPRLWIDGMAFGAHVLRGDENPWATPEQVGLFYRELASLLSLEVIDLDVEAAIEGFCEANALTLDCDDARGLEKLLGRPELEVLISKGIEATLGAAGQRALALSIPGPGKLARAYLSESVIDEDVLDDLSLALTSLVRAIFRPGIGFIRVTESDRRALEFLSPLTNVAMHYECTSVLVLLEEAAPSDEAENFNFIYGEASRDGGIVLPSSWWQGGGALPAHEPLFAKVPTDCVPETALARVAELKEKIA